MFQFSGFPPYHYGFMIRYMEAFHVGFPIRIPADLRLFATPRSFSQLVTSFFGSQCQGIHPALFLLNRFDFTLAYVKSAFFWFSSFSTFFKYFDVFLSSLTIPLWLSVFSVFGFYGAYGAKAPIGLQGVAPCVISQTIYSKKKEEMPGSHLLSHSLAP